MPKGGTVKKKKRMSDLEEEMRQHNARLSGARTQREAVEEKKRKKRTSRAFSLRF